MDVRIGARFRALRHRLGWRQADLARRAAVSAGVVSLVEGGQLERVSLAKLRAIAKALDADFLIQLRWRGGDLDRLVDEGHSRLVGVAAEMLRRAGWLVRVEVSYSIYGERGSIDVLALHRKTGALLVVEVKTELTNVEEHSGNTTRRRDWPCPSLRTSWGGRRLVLRGSSCSRTCQRRGAASSDIRRS